MRLGLILCRVKANPNGHMYRGKDRKVKPVFSEDIQKLRNQYQIEEENMFYLRHPYLTVEQSLGHAKALGRPAAKFAEVWNEKRLKFKESVTIEDRLGHLRFREPWD